MTTEEEHDTIDHTTTLEVHTMPETPTTIDLVNAHDRLGARLTAIMDGSAPATGDSEANTRRSLENVKGLIAERLEYLRAQIDAESISYSEIAELQSLADHIAPGDVELAEWAGIPEDQFHLRMADTSELDPGDPDQAAELTRRARMGA